MEKITRKCCRCKIIKPLTDFSVDKSRNFGRNYTCFNCTREKNHIWYTSKLGHKYKKYHRPLARISEIKSVAKHPEKEMARRKSKDAIKTGKIIKCPCEVCNSLPSEAHHPDYSKPLDVKWLCKKHHMEVHFKVY